LRRFIDWVAAYTLNPPGRVLRMAMTAPDAFVPPRERTAYMVEQRNHDPRVGGSSRSAATTGEAVPRMTPARQRVLSLMEGRPPMTAADIAAEAGCGEAVVKGLAAAGALVTVPLSAEAGFPAPDLTLPGLALSPAQAEAATALRDLVEGEGFEPVLLEGVTGSGKTEVYLEAVAAALAQGEEAQVLVLVPEIALTRQWLERFGRRFGAMPAEWHSGLTGAERRRVWRGVSEGRARVVVGARSALFLPFVDLKLIVVDEEHDASFKQEDGVIYQARDMAVVRAKIEGIAVVMVSATPSLETLANAAEGRYRHVTLADRHGGAALPDISLIDMRRHPPERGHWLSPPLVEALARNLDNGEQALLFLNRRGYAPLTLCRHCGHRFQCPNCTAWMVDHRQDGTLQCHHCGLRMHRPRECPACGKEDALVACGPGVERLAEEVAERYPAARQAILSSDMAGGPPALADLIARIGRHEIDIVIGTQIVAKGHHFPMLTLVGVVDADLGLLGGDLRAGERSFQLLSQVAGRAGREERPGRVLLQTFMPEHPVMAALAAYDREAFLAAQMEERREAGWPPFGRLAALIVSSPHAGAAMKTAERLARTAPAVRGLHVLGPAPAPLALLRGRHRVRLLVRAEKGLPLQAILRQWLMKAGAEKGVTVTVDIDPQSFM
jgi:primosomal protein N' (replication factor Y)